MKLWNWAVCGTLGLLAIIQWEPAPIDTLIPLLVLLMALNIGVLQPRFSTSLPLTALIVFILVLMAVSIPNSPSFAVSLRYWAITGLVALLTLIGYYIGQRIDLTMAALTGMFVFAAGSTLIAVLGHIGVLPIADIVSYGGFRLKGFTKNPNMLGQYLSFISLIGFAMVIEPALSRPLFLRRSVIAVMSLIVMSGVILSASRGALGITAISISLFFLLLPLGRIRVGGKRIMVTIGTAVGGAALSLRFLPQDMVEYVLGRADEPFTGDARFDWQAEALSLVPEHFWIGHGPMSTYLDMGAGTHNVFVLLLYEHGFLGFVSTMVLWLFPLLISAYYVWNPTNVAIKLLATLYFSVLVGQLAFGLVVDIIHVRHVWLLVGLIWSLPLLARRVRSEYTHQESDISVELSTHSTVRT